MNERQRQQLRFVEQHRILEKRSVEAEKQADTATAESRIVNKEYETDLKRVKKLKGQEKYGKLSKIVAPFSKSLSRRMLEKSNSAAATYPAALRKAIDSGDQARDKHIEVSEKQIEAAKHLRLHAEQYSDGGVENNYFKGQALHYDSMEENHSRNAIKINKQALDLREERKKLLKKLGTPPEYSSPAAPKGDPNENPPRYRP